MLFPDDVATKILTEMHKYQPVDPFVAEMLRAVASGRITVDEAWQKIKQHRESNSPSPAE